MRWRAWSFALVIVVGVVGGLFLWAAPSGAQGPGRAGEAAVPAVEGPLAEVRRAMYAGREWEVLGRGWRSREFIREAQPQAYETPDLPPPQFVKATKAVFQWDRNKTDWDIYLADSAMQQVLRLTYDRAADVHPQLNPGATKVAFASDRVNQTFQIFVMNSDGTNVQQLTWRGENLRPRWSPDGTKLVYQSNRDGDWEIYVINADGTGERRLTVSPSYDGMPTWSPDGEWIAFISDRISGLPQIWKMRPDGSDVQLVGGAPVSLFPLWSPYGWIYFAADGNGDGFLELWRIRLSDGLQLLVIDCSGKQVRADCFPTGQTDDFFLYTHLDYFYVPGYGFVPVEASLRWGWEHSTEGVSLSLHRFPAVGGPDGTPETNEMMGDWSGVETSAPQVTLLRVPREVSTEKPQGARWEGWDGGGSGLRCFDLQRRRVGEQTWRWGRECFTQTSLSLSDLFYPDFFPEAGLWEFRLRAHDWAGNLGRWGLFRIRVYQWRDQGQVLDARERPVGGVRLEIVGRTVYSSFDPRTAWFTFFFSTTGGQFRAHHPAFFSSEWRDYWQKSDERTSWDPSPWNLFLRRREGYVVNPDFITDFQGEMSPWKRGGSLFVYRDWKGRLRFESWTGNPVGEGWISQRIVLPKTAPQPTLAFLVVSTGTQGFTGHRFEVLLSVPTETVIFSMTAPHEVPLHVWRDLSPWAGRSFTLTFRLKRLRSDAESARVELWGLSLDPWTTPWITEVAQSPYDPSVTGTLVLTGDNFFSSTVVLKPLDGGSPVTLTTVLSQTGRSYLKVQVPPRVPPGVYQIRVVNADGTDAVAAEPFISGWPVYLPASLREMWP